MHGRQLQPCGTPAAARRHHKRGEPLDPACREAFRRYHREYRRAARQIDAFRRRELDARARWEKRINADPARREHRRRKQRQSARARQVQLTLEFRGYCDPVVIERLVTGQQTHSTATEKRAAFHSLRTQGHSRTAAATRLGISGATAREWDASRCPEIVLKREDDAAMTATEGATA